MPLQPRTASPPAAFAVLPFLFARVPDDDRGWHFQAAIHAARAAEAAVCEPRNSRRRIAYFLCELTVQLGRRSGDSPAPIPLSRTDIADALGVSLCRVKRVLALLSLAQVIAFDGEDISVLDWRRLCALADYDQRRFGSALPDEEEEEEEEEIALPADEDEALQRETAAGDPAFFG